MAFTRTLIAEFALANRFYSNAQVTFHQVDPVTGAKLTTLVTLYEDVTGTDTLANPVSLDHEGKLTAYIDEPTIGDIATADAALDHSTGIIQTNLAGDSATEAANSASVAQAAAVQAEEFAGQAEAAALIVPNPGAAQSFLRGNGSGAYILRSGAQVRTDIGAGTVGDTIFTAATDDEAFTPLWAQAYLHGQIFK